MQIDWIGLIYVMTVVSRSHKEAREKDSTTRMYSKQSTSRHNNKMLMSTLLKLFNDS